LGTRYPGPAESLESYLRDECSELTVLSHPLNADSDNVSQLVKYKNGQLVKNLKKNRYLPHPLGRVFDPIIFTNPFLGQSDIIIGFNSLSVFQGSLVKFFRRSILLCHWGVDYLPDEARSSIIRKIENLMNRINSRQLNFQIEATTRAASKRQLKNSSICKLLNPIGLDSFDYIEPGNLANKNKTGFIFLGSLNERTGVNFAIDVVDELRWMIPDVKLEIVGLGPLRDNLEKRVTDLNLSQNVTFHGFLPEGLKLRNLLDEATFGFAPFPHLSNSFTHFADPHKMKRYMGAGLIVLTTREVEMSGVLESERIGLVFGEEATPNHWAKQILLVSKDEDTIDIYRKKVCEFSPSLSNKEYFSRTMFELFKCREKLQRSKHGSD
jgi:glycosyltransferase involved in cell wall biosynthesis